MIVVVKPLESTLYYIQTFGTGLGPGRHPETCKDPLHLYRKIEQGFTPWYFYLTFLLLHMCHIIQDLVKQTKIPIF